MENNKYGYSTYTFKELVPDYTTFSDTYKDGLLTTLPSQQTFKLLYNEFAESHIAFTKERFICKFENVLYQTVEAFEYDTNVKRAMREFEDSVFEDEGDMITNIATAPNNEYDTDEERVNHLDQQQKMKARASKANAYYKRLTMNKETAVKTFLNKFRQLFIVIFDAQANTVWIDNKEGE